MQYIAKTKSVKSKTQNHSSKFKIRIKKEVRSHESDVGARFIEPEKTVEQIRPLH